MPRRVRAPPRTLRGALTAVSVRVRLARGRAPVRCRLCPSHNHKGSEGCLDEICFVELSATKHCKLHSTQEHSLGMWQVFLGEVWLHGCRLHNVHGTAVSCNHVHILLYHKLQADLKKSRPRAHQFLRFEF